MDSGTCRLVVVIPFSEVSPQLYLRGLTSLQRAGEHALTRGTITDLAFHIDERWRSAAPDQGELIGVGAQKAPLACNELAAHAPADVYMFCMPAIVVQVDTIATLAATVGTDDVVAAEPARLPIPRYTGLAQETGAARWLRATCLAVRGAAWQEAGGFDPGAAGLWSSDLDLGWRLRASGGRLQVCQDVAYFDPRAQAEPAAHNDKHAGEIARLLALWHVATAAADQLSQDKATRAHLPRYRQLGAEIFESKQWHDEAGLTW